MSPNPSHEGYDQVGGLTTHQGLLENCPAPECQDRLIEQHDAAEPELTEVQFADAVLAVDWTADNLATARETNQRLNYEKQRLESELAAYRRAVGQWEISETGTYVPLRTLAVIAKAAGLNVPERWELHYERVERAEAELRRVAAAAGPADTVRQDVSEKRVVAYRSPGSRTLYCITCARQETGWQPLTEVLDDAVCDFCGGRILAIASRTLGAVIARHVEEPPAAAQQSKEA